MALFKSEKELPNAVTTRATQKTIDLLESISSADKALSVPYLRIHRVDPRTRLPDENGPMNIFFLPANVNEKKWDRRFNERPAVSLQDFSVITKQNYGDIIEQHVEMNIVAHRPSSLFDEGDKGWSSLITPGETHLVEYGWNGTSKNDLINGNGYSDNSVFIPSRKRILFTTYYYTFKFNKLGEIEFSIKGMQNGNFVFRKIELGDVVNNSTISSGDVPNPDFSNSVDNLAVRKKLQALLTKIEENAIKIGKSKKKKYVKFIDVLNGLVADTIDKRSREWGYDEVSLEIGLFNPKVPPTAEKYKLENEEIANFMLPIDDVRSIIGNSTKKGLTLSIENFITKFLTIINNNTTWAPGKLSDSDRLGAEQPNIKIKVIDESTSKKKRLAIKIFDIKRDLVKIFPKDALVGEKTRSREAIKKILRDRRVPFISFGKALSYIDDMSFEVIMDNQIQRAKIDTAAQHLKTRTDVTSKSLRDLIKEDPNTFHQIWDSAIEGEIMMLGNFAFDVFSILWLDFDVNIWNGPFNIRTRADVVNASGFQTTISVISEGTDPLNTKRRLSQSQLNALAKIESAHNDMKIANTQLRGSARKRAIQNAQKKINQANEELRLSK